MSRRPAGPGRTRPARFVGLAGLTAGAAGAAWAALDRDYPGAAGWRRANFRDREVTLLLGPAVAGAALAGLVASWMSGEADREEAGHLSGALLVVGTAAAVGAYDDRFGDRHARGLRGHLRALAERRVTTGMVKLAALTASAAAGSAIRHRRPADVALSTVLTAGGANLVNLFDLRPGRAAKVSLAAAALLAASASPASRDSAAVAAGAALAALPSDLGERAMLGDCGAGALGALLGWAAAGTGSRRRRVLAAAGVVGLTAASERVSFSAVIDARPALRSLDRLGRMPA